MSAHVASPIRPLSQGRTLASTRIGAMRVVETSHAPRLRLEWHTHERPCITVVLAGQVEERFGHVVHTCRPLDVLLKPAGAEHANSYGVNGARCMLIEFDPDAEETMEAFMRFDARRARVAGGVAAVHALRLLESVRLGGTRAAIETEELAFELATTFADGPGRGRQLQVPRWLQNVRDALHACIAEPPTLTALAADANVHPVYLARAFRRKYGWSVGHYLRRLRVGEAANRLARTTDSIAIIAAETGFCDQSHLNRVFRSETSIAPAAYRRLAGRLTSAAN